MVEWNGLTFEAKPVPENWREELVELRQKWREFRDRRRDELGLKKEYLFREIPKSELCLPKKEDALSWFETIRNTPVVWASVCETVQYYENNPDEITSPETEKSLAAKNFPEWWELKYIAFEFQKLRYAHSLIASSVGGPVRDFIKHGDLIQAYQDISDEYDKFSAKTIAGWGLEEEI